MKLNDSPAHTGMARPVSEEVIALYREARAATAPNFKAWAMARCARLVPIHSTSWINGVMTPQGPVFHHVRTGGLRAGYWEHFLTLMDIDPLGPRMFASPGRSFVTGYNDMPPRIRDEIMIGYDVRSALSGMAADPTTGTFSVVCWHRDPSMPLFTAAEQALHEQLLPHWVECLNLHRVGTVLRDLHATVVPGRVVALVETTGLIHYVQLGFGELIAEEFAGWPGTSLPAPLMATLLGTPPGNGTNGSNEVSGAVGANESNGTHGLAHTFAGTRISASARPAAHQLWMVHAARRLPSTLGVAGEVELGLLSSSLDARERELDEARRALHEQEKREAVLQERQRMLRELHDGVGAHLVGLRSLLQRGAAAQGDMAAAIEDALDEMRMAVDSLQAVDGDLTTLLATLRWRMQPRLDAAGIAVRWNVPQLPLLDSLSPAVALQIQRLLLEGLTNVLKHSRASAVEIEARADGRSWAISLRDNGVGLPASAGAAMRGQGLANMARRAAEIGARFSIGPLLGQAGSSTGTSLELSWPAAG